MSGVPNLDRYVTATTVAMEKIVALDTSDDDAWTKQRRAMDIITPLIEAAGDAVRYSVLWATEPAPVRRPAPSPARTRRRWFSRV